MNKVTTLEKIEKGEYLIKEVTYQSPEGIVRQLSPMLVEKVRKNFVDFRDDYSNIRGSVRRSTFTGHSSNLGKTVTWYSIA